MDYSLPGSSVHGIPQERIPARAAISCYRRSSQSRHRTYTSWITRQFKQFFSFFTPKLLGKLMSHLHAISLWMHILIFLKWIWRSGTATSQNSFMFNSLKTRLFSKSAESQYIPISSVCGFQILDLLTKTCYYLFDCKRPSGGEAVPHCGLNLHLDDNLILSSIFSYTIFFSG